MLLVGLGRATRLLRFLTELPKTYTGQIVLGTFTSTLDDEGEVLETWDMSGVTMDAVRAAAHDLTGPIMQVPPMVSAVRVGGRRLHELAREGIEVVRDPRPVIVHRFDVEATEDPTVLEITVTCSSGTFVRVLAADLGAALGGGAHLRRLRRTLIGSFGVDAAHGLDALEASPGPAVLSPADALVDYGRIDVDADIAAQVVHGRPLGSDVLPVDGDGPWAVCGPDGQLLAVYEDRPGSGVRYPAVVMAVDDPA